MGGIDEFRKINEKEPFSSLGCCCYSLNSSYTYSSHGRNWRVSYKRKTAVRFLRLCADCHHQTNYPELFYTLFKIHFKALPKWGFSLYEPLPLSPEPRRTVNVILVLTVRFSPCYAFLWWGQDWGVALGQSSPSRWFRFIELSLGVPKLHETRTESMNWPKLTITSGKLRIPRHIRDIEAQSDSWSSNLSRHIILRESRIVVQHCHPLKALVHSNTY